MGPALTTVFVKQGHYALASEKESIIPAPDAVIGTIDELMDSNFTTLQVTS